MFDAELKDSTLKSRHIGPTNDDEALMLQHLGFKNLEEFISSVIPNEIFDLVHQAPNIPEGCNQIHALKEINQASVASCRSVEQVVKILSYVINGELENNITKTAE